MKRKVIIRPRTRKISIAMLQAQRHTRRISISESGERRGLLRSTVSIPVRCAAPNLAFYTPEGEWLIENVGVPPDEDLEFDPKAWRAGRDPQLEKAVEMVLEELQQNPPKTYQRPAYPNYYQNRRQP